jgi:hypothetical protein
MKRMIKGSGNLSAFGIAFSQNWSGDEGSSANQTGGGFSIRRWGYERDEGGDNLIEETAKQVYTVCRSVSTWPNLIGPIHFRLVKARSMARQHVDSSDIARFAQEKVNLPKDKADEYRGQARRLREKLDGYLSEHPDFTLKKMLLSGSLAKGTALRSLNDIDVACYISGVDVPSDVTALLNYLADRLRKAFPNFSPDQVKPQTYSVTVSFRGTGLDVDVVPILYDDDPQWYGNLVSQDDGSFLETSIPLHLSFTQKRKQAQEVHFAQVVRLTKFWVRNVKQERENFRFKSFMIELILSHLSDQGLDFADYPEALQHFFTYVVRSNMRERIVFRDCYKPTAVGSFTELVQIIDPVNAKNNVSRLYTDDQADAIVDAALDAGDAIDAALAAQTKHETVYYWQKVFGSSFQI